jgi:hypothetical protein
MEDIQVQPATRHPTHTMWYYYHIDASSGTIGSTTPQKTKSPVDDAIRRERCTATATKMGRPAGAVCCLFLLVLSPPNLDTAVVGCATMRLERVGKFDR